MEQGVGGRGTCLPVYILSWCFDVAGFAVYAAV